MNKQFADFLLKGGRLIDPAGRKDGLFDIRVCNGRIDAIGANLEPNAATVIDVKDHIVTQGLIDVHLHLMKGLGAFGVDPGYFRRRLRVTTVVDAGSAGHTPLNVFPQLRDRTPRRVLNYINLSTLGGVSGRDTAFSPIPG
jgi:dihydroorotase